MQITAKAPKTGRSFSVDYPMPEDLSGLVAKFGDKGVYDAAVDRLVVNIQNVVRNGLNKDEPVTDEELRDAALNYVPGQRAARETKSPFERVMAGLGNLTAEQRQALAQALKKAA